MKLQALAIAVSFTAIVAVLIPVGAERSRPAEATALKASVQQTSISLRAADLSQPHWLHVTPARSGVKLSGTIALNGRAIQVLGRQGTRLNLAPLLSPGKHVIEIRGSYVPASAGAIVEFIGSNSTIRQETRGDGTLQQAIVIHVR